MYYTGNECISFLVKAVSESVPLGGGWVALVLTHPLLMTSEYVREAQNILRIYFPIARQISPRHSRMQECLGWNCLRQLATEKLPKQFHFRIWVSHQPWGPAQIQVLLPFRPDEHQAFPSSAHVLCRGERRAAWVASSMFVQTRLEANCTLLAISMTRATRFGWSSTRACLAHSSLQPRPGFTSLSCTQ